MQITVVGASGGGQNSVCPANVIGQGAWITTNFAVHPGILSQVGNTLRVLVGRAGQTRNATNNCPGGGGGGGAFVWLGTTPPAAPLVAAGGGGGGRVGNPASLIPRA